eukprot:261540_1
MSTAQASLPTCICGGKLTATKGMRVYCDGCAEHFTESNIVFSCKDNRFCKAHPQGYDLCTNCAKNNRNAPSNAAYLALRQMGYSQKVTFNALKLSNGDMQKALELLTNGGTSKAPITSNDHEKLRSQLKQYKETILSLKSANSLLQQKNISLSNQVNTLLDDHKEMELTIKSLNEEIKLLKKQNIDESNFINWDHEQILLWILSINDGYFDKYSSILSQELSDCEIKGNDLLELSTKDIRGLGVKVFSDAKKLEKCIQELINKYANKHPGNISMNNEGVHAPTSYM